MLPDGNINTYLYKLYLLHHYVMVNNLNRRCTFHTVFVMNIEHYIHRVTRLNLPEHLTNIVCYSFIGFHNSSFNFNKF